MKEKEKTMDKKLKEQGIVTRQRIYDFLVEYITKNGYSPSYLEIADGTGLKAKSRVHHYISVLEDMGKIHTQNRKPRTISLVDYKFVKED